MMMVPRRQGVQMLLGVMVMVMVVAQGHAVHAREGPGDRDSEDEGTAMAAAQVTVQELVDNLVQDVPQMLRAPVRGVWVEAVPEDWRESVRREVWEPVARLALPRPRDGLPDIVSVQDLVNRPQQPATYLLLGVLLLVVVLPLTQHRWFQYLLAALSGVAIAFALALVYAMSYVSESVRRVPGGTLLQPSLTLLFASAGVSNLPYLSTLLVNSWGLLLALWQSSMVGKVYVAACSCLAVFLVWYFQVFKDPNAPSSHILRILVRTLAGFCFYHGTGANNALGIALFVICVFRSHIEWYIRRIYMYIVKYRGPGADPVSKQEYERQTHERTRAELAKLKVFYSRNPQAMASVSEGVRPNLSLFAQGIGSGLPIEADQEYEEYLNRRQDPGPRPMCLLL